MLMPWRALRYGHRVYLFINYSQTPKRNRTIDADILGVINTVHASGPSLSYGPFDNNQMTYDSVL